MDKTSSLMKHLTIFFTFIILFSCEDRQTKNDLTIQNLNGKVKVLTQSFHDPIEKFGKIEYESQISKYSSIQTTVFNEVGATAEVSGFDGNGNLKWKTVYKYDDNDNNIESTNYNPDGTPFGKQINKFNKDNRLIESEDFDETGNLKTKLTTKYDSVGNMVQETFTYDNDKWRKTIVSKYDTKLNNIENFHFANDTLVNRVVNRYDDKGNRIETTQYYPLKNEQTLQRLKYDKNNNEIESIETKDNLIVSKVTSVYDDTNNLIEAFIYGVGGSLEVHRKHLYEFDSSNNWTKQIIIVDDKAYSVILREIEYY